MTVAIFVTGTDEMTPVEENILLSKKLNDESLNFP